MAIFCPFAKFSGCPIIFFNNKTMVQNINNIAKALDTALIIFIKKPICEGSSANTENTAPNI